MSLRIQWRTRDPEDLLLEDPWDELGGYGVVKLSHLELRERVTAQSRSSGSISLKRGPRTCQGLGEEDTRT